MWESGHARVEPRVVPTWFRLFRLTSIWKSRVDLSRVFQRRFNVLNGQTQCNDLRARDL